MGVSFGIELVFALACIADIVTFCIVAKGNPANFMYYLCRPLWGLIHGKTIGMMIGFIIRIVEIIIAAVLMYRIIEELF